MKMQSLEELDAVIQRDLKLWQNKRFRGDDFETKKVLYRELRGRGGIQLLGFNEGIPMTINCSRQGIVTHKNGDISIRKHVKYGKTLHHYYATYDTIDHAYFLGVLSSKGVND